MANATDIMFLLNFFCEIDKIQNIPGKNTPTQAAFRSSQQIMKLGRPLLSDLLGRYYGQFYKILNSKAGIFYCI